MIVVLAVIAPLVLAAGLMVRRPMPRMERLPEPVGPAVVDPGQVIATYHRGSGLVFGLEARLIRRTESPSGLSLVVEALGDSGRPELLIYWAPGKSRSDGALPGDAALLGALAILGAVRVDLPARATVEDGHLILYSPTQNAVDQTWNLPTLERREGV